MSCTVLGSFTVSDQDVSKLGQGVTKGTSLTAGKILSWYLIYAMCGLVGGYQHFEGSQGLSHSRLGPTSLVLHSIRPQFPYRLSVREMFLCCILNAGQGNFIGEAATPLS